MTDSNSKRRRFDGPAAASISSLPDAVLRLSFSFIGPGHFRFVAGTSLTFRQVYIQGKHEKKTTWKNVAASTECAELCLEDVREQEENKRIPGLNLGRKEQNTVREIAFAAAKTGRVNMLEWARVNGCDFGDSAVTFKGFIFGENAFRWAARLGHTNVLEWALENNLDLASDFPMLACWAPMGGQVSVLGCLHNHGMMVSTFDLFEIIDSAVENGHVAVLDWILQNGFDAHETKKYAVDAATGRRAYAIEILEWAKERDYDFATERTACISAAAFGNLAALQWLRQNECPWDAGVIQNARSDGHDDVVEWAIANGCPETGPITWLL